MKLRIYSIILLFLVCGTAMSQKKEISTAKENVKKGTNLDNAEQSMQKLLGDSSNRNNTKIWDILFESLRKQYNQGNEKLYLNQKYDTVSLFNIASRMFTAMESYDSIDALPDKKGKIKLSYRKENSSLLNTLRPNLYNGGRFFIMKQKYSDAYRLLDQYLNTAEQPLFESFHYDAQDKLMPEVAYWAVYAAYKLKDSHKVMKYTPLALKDTIHHAMVLQYLSETYQQEKDTANYHKTLTEGFNHYPLSPFFYPHLIEFYSQQKQWDKALVLTNRALKEDSCQITFHLAKSSILLNQGNYKQSFAISDSLLQKNDSLPEANLNAGLAKFNEGVMMDKMVQSTRNKKNILKLYREALPYLEKYRMMHPDKLDTWGLPLYTIYLNLNMGKQFDEIDKLMKK